jgi:hypothetical protein
VATPKGRRPTTRTASPWLPVFLDYELRIASCDALGAAAGGDPVEEALHAGAFAPHQGEEFAGVEVGGFIAEEGFHAPLDVGGRPRAEAVTFGHDPVVAEGVQHRAAEIGNGKSENGKRVAGCELRADGRIGARATRGR